MMDWMDLFGCVEREAGLAVQSLILADNAGIGRKRNSGRRLDFVGLRIYALTAPSGAARVAKRDDRTRHEPSCGYYWQRAGALEGGVVFIKRLQQDGWS